MASTKTVRKFLDGIPLKHVGLRACSPQIHDGLEEISQGQSIVFIFDVEFQYVQSRLEVPHILELGGILFIRRHLRWFYLANFHINFGPVSDIRNLRLLQSQYASVSPSTLARLQGLEQAYLYGERLASSLQDSDLFFRIIGQARMSCVKKVEALAKQVHPRPSLDLVSRTRIAKRFREVEFSLRRKDVGAETCDRVWTEYFRDVWVRARLVTPTRSWTAILRQLMTCSTVVVKGNMDLTAVNSLFRSSHLPVLKSQDLYVADIADYNKAFFELSGSARLEDTVRYLRSTGVMPPGLKRGLEEISRNLVCQNKDRCLKAHNPLMDAYMTLEVALGMQSALQTG